MSTPVTHGADTDQLRQVAEGLSGSARRVLQIEHAGTLQMGTLAEAWAGHDTVRFAADWQAAGPQLVDAAQLLSVLAKLLVEQAEQQDLGSGGSGLGGGVAGSTPGTGGRDLVGDLADLVPGLFSVNDGDGRYWPDLTAAAGPKFGPQDPALRRLFDMGTDWANDVYVDHIRDAPFSAAPVVERGLKESSDWVRDLKDEYESKKTNRWPIDGPSILLDIVADELDTYGKILHDPKGWWDNDATTWDKVGIGISLIPGVGYLAKGALKTTKEAFDVVAKGFKHVPTKRVWADDLADLDDATKRSSSNNPVERVSAENAETAKKLIAENDIKSTDDVWDSGIRPRGLIIESIHHGNLPASFKAIDRIETVDGVDRAVSTKTLDASQRSYVNNPKQVEYRLNRYIRDLDRFQDHTHTSPGNNKVTVRAEDYDEKILEVIVRPETMKDDHWAALERARTKAAEKGIKLEVKEWP